MLARLEKEGVGGALSCGPAGACCWRPLKTICSSLDARDESEASDGAGEGLLILICAKASAATGDGGEGFSRSGRVPARRPALTNSTGMWRRFLE